MRSICKIDVFSYLNAVISKLAELRNRFKCRNGTFLQLSVLPELLEDEYLSISISTINHIIRTIT